MHTSHKRFSFLVAVTTKNGPGKAKSRKNVKQHRIAIFFGSFLVNCDDGFCSFCAQKKIQAKKKQR